MTTYATRRSTHGTLKIISLLCICSSRDIIHSTECPKGSTEFRLIFLEGLIYFMNPPLVLSFVPNLCENPTLQLSLSLRNFLLLVFYSSPLHTLDF